MKKRILTLCAGLCAAFLLCACSGNPLPEGMTETAVLDTGRLIVTDLNEGNYQSIYALMRDDAQQTTSPEDIQTYMEGILEEVGPFVTEEDSLATGQKLDSGEQYGTAVFYCKHEKDNAMYRIAFSADMELLGLQVTKQ